MLDGTSPVSLPVLNFNGGGFNPGFDTDRPVTVTNLNVTGAGTISGGGSVTVPSGGSFSKTGSGTLSVTNSGTFGESADLILNVDAGLDGGSMCVGVSSDGNADLPTMQINQDFAIGAGADADHVQLQRERRRRQRPERPPVLGGPGTMTNHGRFDVAGGMPVDRGRADLECRQRHRADRGSDQHRVRWRAPGLPPRSPAASSAARAR